MVLIHGITGSVEDWAYNIGALSLCHRVYALELTGLGRYFADEPGFSLDDATGLVKSFMGALDIQTAAIIGHSLGGRVALHFASQFPEMTTHLVLATSSGLGKGSRWRCVYRQFRTLET